MTSNPRLDRWRAKNPDYVRNQMAALRDQARQTVFDHYGWVCSCCGSRYDLTIDHVDGKGYWHRQELFGDPRRAGWHFYRWLIRNGLPDGYVTLCRRCNQSKKRWDRCMTHSHTLRPDPVRRAS